MKRRRVDKLFTGIKRRDHAAAARKARDKRDAPKKPGREWTKKELEPVIILNPDDPPKRR